MIRVVHSTRAWATLAVSALALGGCGTTITAQRVEKSAKELLNDGIVYALPQTVVSVRIPVNLKIPSGGIYTAIWDDCQAACEAGNKPLALQRCKYDLEPKVALAPLEVLVRSEPDPAHRYRVSATADTFQTLNYKFTLSSDGILQDTNSASANTAYEIVSSVVKGLVSLIPVAAGVAAPAAAPATSPAPLGGLAGRPGSAPTHAPPAPAVPRTDCGNVQLSIATEINSNPASGLLSCTRVDEIKSCLAPDAAKAGEAEADRAQAVRTAALTATSADVIKVVDAEFQKDVDKANAKLAWRRTLYGLEEASSTKVSVAILMDAGIPKEHADFPFGPLKIADALADKTATIEGQPEGIAKARPILEKKLVALSLNGSVAREEVLADPCDRTDCATSPESGYRYRVPAKGRLNARIVNGAVGPKEQVVANVSASIPVAQYGALATLPSTFKGKGGKVVVTLNRETGGIQTVEIGADALPTSAVTDVTTKATEKIQARRDASDAKDAKDTELDALKREAALEELKKKIRDAKKDAPS